MSQDDYKEKIWEDYDRIERSMIDKLVKKYGENSRKYFDKTITSNVVIALFLDLKK